MQIKSIVAAVAVLASASSFAAINSPSTGNGGLFLTIVDSELSTPESYTLDLGTTLNDLAAHVGEANYTQSWDINDANFTTFLSNAGGNLSGLQWLVTAGSNKGALSTAGTQKLISTVAAGTDLATVGTTTQANLQGGIGGVGTGIDKFTSAVNAIGTSALAQQGTSDAYFGTGGGLTDALNGKLSFSQLNSFTATDVLLVLLSNPGGRAGTTPSVTTAFAGKLSLVADTVNGGYDLVYGNVTPAVPEPGTYAMLLAGIVGVAAVARRRKA